MLSAAKRSPAAAGGPGHEAGAGWCAQSPALLRAEWCEGR